MNFSRYDDPDRAERIFAVYCPEMGAFGKVGFDDASVAVATNRTCEELDLALDELFIERSVPICGSRSGPFDPDSGGLHSVAYNRWEDSR
ncbi:hypothetical protein CMI47_00405 [Candidatus Pacearchaeota archaeon]|nr:hypothetical protein [Candidatus Pacearchaeota archaeon]|tara:strand:+ start:2545 stop:2814 length:270 start_codon:yes stop_codon:yes gene_type:complete